MSLAMGLPSLPIPDWLRANLDLETSEKTNLALELHCELGYVISDPHSNDGSAS
jgi:hypothetical protein